MAEMGNELPYRKFTRTIILLVFLLIHISFPACKPEAGDDPTGEGKIIVLMYHRIVDGNTSNLYERSIGDLESDIKYLSDNNINIIDFDELGLVLSGGKMPAGNSAIITFDDGDHSWYSLVRPLFAKHKIKAAFFLWTNMIGENSFLSWEEVENMSHYTINPGIRLFTFGSHSCSHRYLYQSKNEYPTPEEYKSFLDYEFGSSKQIIEKHTPGNVRVFALPYGDGAGESEIIDAAKRNGYQFIRTSYWGAIENTETDPFFIPSLPMLDSTDPQIIGTYLGL